MCVLEVVQSHAGIGIGTVSFQASTSVGVNSSVRPASLGLELVGEAWINP